MFALVVAVALLLITDVDEDVDFAVVDSTVAIKWPCELQSHSRKKNNNKQQSTMNSDRQQALNEQRNDKQ